MALQQRLAIALGVAMLGAASPAMAQVVDPSFENGFSCCGFSTYGTGSTFGGWTVSSGSIDLINSFWTPHSGAQSVDMNGASVGTIFQNVATTPGTTYDLSFYMSGNGAFTKTMDVYWGGLAAANRVGSYTWTGDGSWSYSNMEWTQMTATGLLATGSSTPLYFQSTTTGQCCQGPALDDVSLTATTTTPEPASLALLGAGLLGVSGVAARRRRVTSV